MPPQLRSKSRFLNLFEVSKWLQVVQTNLAKSPQTWTDEQRKGLDFLQNERELIVEMSALCQSIKYIGRTLKNKGLSAETTAEIRQYFEQNPHISPRFADFSTYILTYCEQQLSKVPAVQNLMVCSDIIESTFGKLKFKQRYASHQSFQQSVFIMPLYAKKISQQDCKQALEKYTNHEISQKITDRLTTNARTKRRIQHKKWEQNCA